MNERDLKKLNRADLLKLLIDQMTENDTLRSENDRLVQELADRRIDLETAGSIAEAALKVNGVFEAAEAAASQYLENISAMHKFAVESANVVAKRAEEILSDAQQEAQQILLDAQEESQKILLDARENARRIQREAVHTWTSVASSVNMLALSTTE